METTNNKPTINTIALSVFIFYILVSTIQLINFFVFLAGDPSNALDGFYIIASFFVLILNILSIRLLFDGYEAIRWFLTLIAVFSIPFVLTAFIIGLTVAPSLSAMNFVFNLLIYLSIGLMYHRNIETWFDACEHYRQGLHQDK